MANLFDGLRKADDNALKMQIAMLQEVRLSNIRREITQKAKRNTIKAANYVTNFIAKKQFNEPEVINLSVRVKDNYDTLSDYNKEELLTILSTVLEKRLKDAGETIRYNLSEDELSNAILNCVIKHFKGEIPSNLTPAQKTDVIRHRYNIELVFRIRKIISKLEYEKAREFENLLTRHLKELSRDEKDDYFNSIRCENLSGTFTKNLFTTDDGNTLIIEVLDNDISSEHVVFKKIIRDVFSYFLGININFNIDSFDNQDRLFIENYSEWISFIGIENLMAKSGELKLLNEMLLEIIWFSREYYGRCYTPYLQELACWFEDEESRRNKILDTKNILESMKYVTSREQEFVDFKTNYMEQLEKYNTSKEYIDKLREQRHEISSLVLNQYNELASCEEAYEAAKKEYINVTNIFDKRTRAKCVSEEDRKELETIKIDYDKKRKDVEFKKKEIDVTNKRIDEILKEINEKQISSKSLKEDVEKADKELEKLQCSMSDIKLKLDNDMETISSWLNDIWGARYDRFDFGRNVTTDIVKNLEYDEICDVESVLYEMNISSDPYSMRNSAPGAGVQKGEMITFNTLLRTQVTIYFKAIERDEDELKNISILEIEIVK